MSAYVIVEIDVTDPALYEDYKKMAFASVTAYGGKYIVRGGHTTVFEGQWQPKRMVVLEFESAARAKEWYNSTGYLEAKKVRQQASTGNMILVEGMP